MPARRSRFGALVASIGASANSAKLSDLAPNLLQDIGRIPARYGLN